MGQEVEVDIPGSSRDTKHVMVARGIEMLPDYKREHMSPTFKPAKSDLSKLRKRSQLTRAKQLRRCHKIQLEMMQQGIPYESWLGEILHVFLLRPRLQEATFGAALLLTSYPEQRRSTSREDWFETCPSVRPNVCAVGIGRANALNERRWRQEWGDRMGNWIRQQWNEQPAPMEGVVYYCDDEVGIAMYTATESLLYQSRTTGS